MAIHPVNRGDDTLSALSVLDLPSYRAGAEALLARPTLPLVPLSPRLLHNFLGQVAQGSYALFEDICPGQDAHGYKAYKSPQHPPLHTRFKAGKERRVCTDIERFAMRCRLLRHLGSPAGCTAHA